MLRAASTDHWFGGVLGRTGRWITSRGARHESGAKFEPALFSHHWENHWIYWLAPLSGALLAVLVFVLMDKPATLPKCGDAESKKS
ncbi:aquaporin [Pseudomonas aeruginosa]